MIYATISLVLRQGTMLSDSIFIGSFLQSHEAFRQCANIVL